jgi:ubiquinone/menaquinone biosynthesis C-methylase UbiE
MNLNAQKRSCSAGVSDYYDRVAASWDDLVGLGRQNARFAAQLRGSLNSLLLRASGREVALELGAGTGPHLELTAPLFGKVIACDLSAGMLSVLGRRIATLGLTNVTVLQQDAHDLRGIAPGSIDVVYSIGLFEVIHNCKTLFAEIHRVLKRDGLVAGITSNGGCGWYRLRAMLQGGERHGRTGYFLNARDLNQLLQNAGFTPPQIVYWGAVPPGLQNAVLIRALTAAEAVIGGTRFARHLGVLSFSASKADVPLGNKHLQDGRAATKIA